MTDRALLTLEDHVVAAKYLSYVFDATGDCSGVCVEAENGASEFYVIEGDPTFADYYGIALADDATYDEKRQATLAATGRVSEDSPGWKRMRRETLFRVLIPTSALPGGRISR